MVKSRINKKIDYPENSKLELGDKDLDAQLWDMEINSVPIVIATGNPNYKNENKYGIIMIPIYFIVNQKIINQIGLYEFPSHIEYIDEDGDPIIDELGDMLLYKFVTTKYLRDNNKIEKADDDEEEEEEDHGDENNEEEDNEEANVDRNEKKEKDDGNILPDEGDDVLPEGDDVLPEGDDVLPEGDDVLNKKSSILRMDDDDNSNDTGLLETNEEHLKERKKYKRRGSKNWVQRWLHRKEFTVISTTPDGNCFFESIQKAYESGGKDVTIAQLRDKLSEEVDSDDYFEQALERYNMFNNALKREKLELKQLTQNLKDLKIQYQSNLGYDGPRDKEAMKSAQEMAKLIKVEKNQILKDIKNTKQNLENWDWMKGVKTKENLKEKIKTKSYWADDWSISKMEKLLNVKFIILNEENYDEGDEEFILQCGRHDESITNFNPKYYIILNYTGGNHYELIEWKGKGLLSYMDIPYILRKLIVDRCMEREGGLFALISKFNKLKKKMHGEEDEDQENMEDIDFSEETVFQFYSRSGGKPLPGFGAGEKILSEDIKNRKYKELASIPNWRKVLSNFHEAPFEFDGKNWNGVEWLYQGSKFKEDNPDFYYKFSLDSESELSKNPLLAKAAGGKTGFITEKIVDETGKKKSKRRRVRPKHIVADTSFFTTDRINTIMKEALRAKFTQDTNSKKVLLATYGDGGGLPAKLQHYIRASPPEVWYHLMEIRKDLKDESDVVETPSEVVGNIGNIIVAEVEEADKSLENRGKKKEFNWKTGNFAN